MHIASLVHQTWQWWRIRWARTCTRSIYIPIYIYPRVTICMYVQAPLWSSRHVRDENLDELRYVYILYIYICTFPHITYMYKCACACFVCSDMSAVKIWMSKRYIYILDIYIYTCVTMLYAYIRLYVLHTYVATICIYIRRMHMCMSTYYMYVRMCECLFCRSDKSTLKIWMSWNVYTYYGYTYIHVSACIYVYTCYIHT